MEGYRRVACMLIAGALIVAFFGAASPCYGEASGRQVGGSALVTLGVAVNGIDIGLRVGLEYRSPAGFGAKVAVGTMLTSIIADVASGGPFTPVVTGEALVVLPICRVGRSGALDLALGLPTLLWGAAPRFPLGVTCSAGGAVRLRLGLGTRVSLSVRVGGGYLFVLDSSGFHEGPDTEWRTAFCPDLQLGAALRL
jgi:hypothetical protein